MCMWIKGDFGELYGATVYCRFGEDIKPYLAHMDSVCKVAKGKCLLIGVDANTVSPLWYCKGDGDSRISEMRGRLLEEWVIAKGMNVLNKPSDHNTFSGPNAESNIDVTLVNDVYEGC